MDPVLISAAELVDRDQRQGRTVLLDVRWTLGRTDGHERYLTGHLPGAVYVDLDSELADPPSPERGRHPLPSDERLRAAVRRWGIRDGDTVVAYDDSGNQAAARAWWLLRWAGVPALLLDGGLTAWVNEGGRLSTEDVRPEPGDVQLTPGRLPVLTADDAAGHPTLLDARAAERYRGEVEPIDPRAGHIPGAVSAPTGENLTADGHFRPAAELRHRFAGLGATVDQPVGVYCGSGVTAAHEVAALTIAGFDAALYAGSWSQWSNDPSRPVETGQPPRAAGERSP